MQFCPTCKFMVYTKKIKDDDDNNSKNKLRYYCKNCLWEDDSNNPKIKIDTKTPIYKRNYQDDYIADKIVSNKYTIFDVTLPRVNYNCNNNECISHKEKLDEKFNDINKALLVQNVSADIENIDSEIKKIIDNDTIIQEIIPIKLTNLIIILNNPDNYLEEVKEKLEQKFSDVYTLIKNQNNNQMEYSTNDQTENKKLSDLLKNEVIYIKYDHINMRYLYICTICGESWKKKI